MGDLPKCRSLTAEEIEQVSGGGLEHDVYKWLTGNSGYGASNIVRARAIAGAGGMVGIAFSLGYGAGTMINDATGASNYLADFFYNMNYGN